MSKQPYIPLYTGDYLKDTRSLSLAAKGAWSDLIIFMWSSDERGKLTGNMSDFARLIGGTLEETAAVLLELCLKKVCDKIELQDGYFKIICRRMVREAEISAKKALNGSKGGIKTQANKIAKTQQITDNDIESDIDNEIVIKIDKWPFENFWDAYAKKQDRTKCEKKWANLKDDEREEIMKHVPKYIASTPDIQFRKHPATYLNNRSWENDIIHSNGKQLGTKQQQTIDTAKAVAELYGDVLGKGQAG